MTIVPVSRLSTADMAMLGNNIRPADFREPRRRRSKTDWVTAAVNRSLKVVGERVATLDRRTALAS